ncbi:MAG: lactate racemase domain-containing protein, partial [Kiritimatiellaeota bacterium]|nr:lactate racemase domain-containing protein [Kiritimatiellota bacterium]
GAVPELVIINDPQRGTASPRVLAAIRNRFSYPAPRVLVATGSHRFSAEAQTAFEAPLRKLGFTTIGWHDARASDLVDLGGWRAHPWLAAARTILAIGSVEPHYFAGYTGAHKTLTIGCASYTDIERNHAGAMDPVCRPCHLETSPVHFGVLAKLRVLEADRRLAVINLFQAGDEIRAAAGGTPEVALAALAPLVGQTYLHAIERPADVVIARVAGPLACSFYQADKGIKNNEAAVRSGGVLILEAICPQGIGQNAFFHLLRQATDHRTVRAFVQARGYQLGDHKVVRLRYLTDPACRNVRLFIVSPGLTADDARILGATKAASVEEALRAAGVADDSALVCDVEDAGNTCLEVRAS